ncbi:Ras association domain-containing protein 9 PAM COOH-terminal interactor protein 1 [Takifugu flavidus]|uniref:Ras association domain-containing protein 9 PAM COOH-terminal interactor protein 1 n=1 Tax=Takifugu flavidus TaxID=433684 RepID=A0A5C6P991_9TELE|nr:Ras association domain-containing protein 9 PAM COOH-terminal interactor protein 1 [Takifugu flavidus]
MGRARGRDPAQLPSGSSAFLPCGDVDAVRIVSSHSRIMAPFGKNFLKARLKNRTKGADPVAGKEIQVTVCSEEKVVCGVTKHTTCADMIQALLEDHRSVPESQRLLHGEPKDFCLLERWRGFERALPPLTRILRLWYAWGDQRPSVHFVLVRNSDFVPHPAKRGGKPRSVRPKRWDHSRGQPPPQPAERQRRLVKKAFRKLEKLHKESRNPPGAEEVQRMVQLVLNQDRTIREQIQRMRQLDLEIQRTAVQEQEEQEEQEEEEQEERRRRSRRRREQLQEFIYASERVRHLEQQVQRHQELILQLSRDIDGELRRANAPLAQQGGGEQEGAAAAAASWAPSGWDGSSCAAEAEQLQAELRSSLLTGVSLHTQTAELEKQLTDYDATLVSKDQECWQLAALLKALLIGEAGGEEPPGVESQVSGSPAGARMLRLKGLSPLDATDTDSDTGISSTHSQDSLSPGLDSPPPLDTDV